MQFKHSNRAVSASFDDPNLVSSAGLVPMMVLAMKTGLGALVDGWVKLPDYFGANAGLKVTALVAGMLTGADSIDDMAVLGVSSRNGINNTASSDGDPLLISRRIASSRRSR